MKVYFISGLGADSRVFKHIRLPMGYEMIHLDWIPALKDESMERYSSRLAEKIIPGEQFALIGLSMGGMIACEIAKQFDHRHTNNPVITILVSSVPSHKHFPTHFRLASFLKLHKLVPVSFLKSASILNRFFTADNKEDKAVLRQVIKDSDPAFVRWAIQAILQWKNETIPKPLWHIHGTKDRILPLRYTKPTSIIRNGSHNMVMGRAAELNKLIEEALLSIRS